MPDHRLTYLDYEGPITGGRGSVTTQAAGTYRLMEDRTNCLRMALRWHQEGQLRKGEVEIYRSFLDEDEGRLEERRESWRLRFSPGR